MKRLHGEQAAANYYAADGLVREGRFDDARAVELLPSDRTLIEKKIKDATPTPSDFPSPY